MPPAHKPSMEDVAKHAQVSHQTVWRVVNGVSNVRESTRELVLASINTLGYRRNLSATRLVTQRTRAMGILLPPTQSYGSTTMMYSVEKAVKEAGYHPVISSTEAVAPGRALEWLLDHSVEGILAIAPQRDVIELLESKADGVAVHVIQAPNISDPWVLPSENDVAPYKLIVEHLISLGHRWIQQIAGLPGLIEADNRRKAFSEAVRAAGLPELRTIDGDWTPDSGYRGGDQLDARATAVFCGNDPTAIGLIHRLSERGIAIPDDVSVVGFDDIPEAAHTVPALTTVRSDFPAIGADAVASILHTLGERSAPKSGPLPFTLIIRSSTGLARP